MAYDLVVRGGQVLDGSGLPRFRADVGVIGERIARVGKISERGHREIDAEGLVVTPGFIDGHTHMDAQINWDPLCTSSCHQGVTTVVMGNCGFTLAPSRAENRGWVVRNLERAEDISAEAMAQGIEWGWQTFPEYLDFVDRLPKGLNQSVYVGHSALRTWAMGERAFEAEASADELAAMTQQLRAGVEAGAMGLSTSRSRSHETSDDRPVASRVGAFEEVAALVRTLGELGKGIFEIALGGRTPEELEALAVETRVPMTFGVGAAGGMAWREQLALLDRTAERGGRMIGQTHSRGVTPLLSFEAGLPFDKLPTWRPFRALPLAEQERLLRTDPELRARLVHAAHHEEYPRAVSAEPRRPKWDRVEVRTGPFPPYPNLAALSAEQGRDPMEVMIDLALATPRLSQLFVQTGAPFPDEELLTVLKHPRTVMTFSDSGAHVSQISDCSIHTYLLAYWVRERGAFTLEEAIRMITMTPAAAFGFHDRGLLRQGFAADLNVIDPGAIIPETPRVTTDLPGGAKRFVQGAAGIQATVVNGQVLMEAGVHTGALPGRLLRQ
ncbi:MAG: amidohydrolase family protein [Caulobacteraceae bacterium]|nr:amidohydrolase family protein [Caulobacteraceae bacterium]